MRNSVETRNEKFIRLAEARMEMLLDCMRKLDNLSNRVNYEYTDEQVEQMFSRLDTELAEIKSHFVKKEIAPFKFK